MNKKQVEYLQYKFSDAEIRVLSQDAGRIDQEMKTLENRLDQIKKSLAGELAEKKTELSKLMAKMAGGFEYRNVDCEIQLDTPKQGQASIVRLDTEEVIKVRRMTDEELQIPLSLEEGVPEPTPQEVVEEVTAEVPEPEPEVPPELAEPPIEVIAIEPERTYDYHKPGARASVRVWQDSAGVCHYHAGVIITADDEQKVYDSGIENAFTTMNAAAKDGVLSIWQWAHALYSDSTKIALRGLIFGVVDWVRVTLPTIPAAE